MLAYALPVLFVTAMLSIDCSVYKWCMLFCVIRCIHRSISIVLVCIAEIVHLCEVHELKKNFFCYVIHTKIVIKIKKKKKKYNDSRKNW